ncbi:MAG: hypothetical protein C0396_08605 [Anaerolinea sp.]|nr:hypothetical protein [Anaerolinea sp.]
MLTGGIIPEAANEGKVFRPFYRCASLSDIPMRVKQFGLKYFYHGDTEDTEQRTAVFEVRCT